MTDKDHEESHEVAVEIGAECPFILFILIKVACFSARPGTCPAPAASSHPPTALS